MQKIIFITITYLLNVYYCHSQPTKLILLGSAHIESENLTIKSYENLINVIKPEVILFELDSTDMTPNFEFKQVMLDYVSKSHNDKGQQRFFEVTAVNNYRIKQPNLIVRPYDIKGRDNYFFQHKFYENQAILDEKLQKLNCKDSISIENYIILNHYFNLIKIDELMLASDIKTLNSETYDDIISHSFEWREKNLLKLIKSTPSLTHFENHIKFEYSFWKKRNEEMIKNILKFTKIYSGKKILIITGAYHRYILKNALKQNQSNYNFVLQEHYE